MTASTAREKPRTLVVTLGVPQGGLVTMTKRIVGFLQEAGHEVGLAQPSAPWRPGGRPANPADSGNDSPDGAPAPWEDLGLIDHHRIRAFLPLVEWSRYVSGPGWMRVLDCYDHHVVVTGSVLLSIPLVTYGVPHLSWVATGYWADRRDRFADWPFWRKALDLAVNALPGLVAERVVARHPEVTLAALSEHTADFFAGWRSRPAVLPMGIDTDRFGPGGDEATGIETYGRGAGLLSLGFASRLADPRKNVGLLFAALKACGRRGIDARLHLAGPGYTGELREKAQACGVAGRVKHHGELAPDEMPGFYRALDVFVIPSRQEGLGIVGLEAMACGCPVVSTRCGGPEEYVLPGETGYLVEASPGAMADTLELLACDRDHRRALSRGALKLVEERYDERVVRETFWELFDKANWEACT